MKTGFDKLKVRYVLALLLVLLVFRILLAFFLQGSAFSAWGPLIGALLDLGLFAIIVWLLFAFNISLRTLIGKIPRGLKWGEFAGLFVLLFFFSLGYGYLQLYLFPGFVSEVELWYEFGSPLAIIGTFLSTVLIAPVFEELVFRGIIFQRWAYRWNVRVAIVLSSLVFALLHFSFSTFIVGIVLSLIYIRTRTLLIPIIMHALNNLLSTSIIIYSLIFFGKEKTFEVSQFTAAELYLAVGVVVLTLPLLVYYIYKNWPTKTTRLPYSVNRLK